MVSQLMSAFLGRHNEHIRPHSLEGQHMHVHTACAIDAVERGRCMQICLAAWQLLTCRYSKTTLKASMRYPLTSRFLVSSSRQEKACGAVAGGAGQRQPAQPAHTTVTPQPQHRLMCSAVGLCALTASQKPLFCCSKSCMLASWSLCGSNNVREPTAEFQRT